MLKRALAVSALLGLLGTASGCGGGPALVPVSGAVTLNAKPLEGANIQYLPDSSNTTGLPAEDVTGPTGTYKVMTNQRSGLVPGKYRVVITKTMLPPGAVVPEAFKDDPFMANLSMNPDPQAGSKKKDEDKIEGEFTIDVPPEGGVFDWDVKATAKAVANESAAGS